MTIFIVLFIQHCKQGCMRLCKPTMCVWLRTNFAKCRGRRPTGYQARATRLWCTRSQSVSFSAASGVGIATYSSATSMNGALPQWLAPHVVWIAMLHNLFSTNGVASETQGLRTCTHAPYRCIHTRNSWCCPLALLGIAQLLLLSCTTS